MRWSNNWLSGRSQRVVVLDVESSWRAVIIHVPQGSIVGLFSNNLDDGLECFLIMEGMSVIQQNLDRLERWAEWNLLKHNKASTGSFTRGGITHAPVQAGDRPAGK